MGCDFSSPMADIYINRGDAILEKVVESADNTEREKLERKIEDQEYNSNLQDEKIEKLNEKVKGFKRLENDITNLKKVIINLANQTNPPTILT